MPNDSNARHALLACLLEATAGKPGNVHPSASFDDLTYADFVRSAVAISRSFAPKTDSMHVGRVVLDAVERTRSVHRGNTNLGIVLLLAPLACVPADTPLREGIGEVLGRLDRDDAALVYRAIRLASPGGLGKVDREDVSSAPTVTLLEAMQLAADRDRIAEQYATNFSAVFAGVDRLAHGDQFRADWEVAVISLHLWLMSEFPDTLIARKCGPEVARESATRARSALETAVIEPSSRPEKVAELDAWLRADGHRRNPGTTADLVAACLFAGFRDGRLEPPPIPDAARPYLPAQTVAR